jgi:hypothetical protein
MSCEPSSCAGSKGGHVMCTCRPGPRCRSLALPAVAGKTSNSATNAVAKGCTSSIVSLLKYCKARDALPRMDGGTDQKWRNHHHRRNDCDFECLSFFFLYNTDFRMMIDAIGKQCVQYSTRRLQTKAMGSKLPSPRQCMVEGYGPSPTGPKRASRLSPSSRPSRLFPWLRLQPLG